MSADARVACRSLPDLAVSSPEYRIGIGSWGAFNLCSGLSFVLRLRREKKPPEAAGKGQVVNQDNHSFLPKDRR